MRSTTDDVLVQGTNDSSIVSKRSVERAGYPLCKSYLRCFVKKPQRRTALINRGYYVRMKAVENAITSFMDSCAGKKTVVNLGCGFDPLPFTHLRPDCVFVDIDFPELMEKKARLILQNDTLRQLLGDCTAGTEIVLRCDRYIAIGGDLRDLDHTCHLLELAGIDLTSPVMFVAEVSLTYMPTGPADAFLRWAASLPHSSFVLIEQIAPAGENHPFARTMLAHFKKIGTPLQSVSQYPTIDAQRRRVRDAGWSSVSANDLLKVWHELPRELRLLAEEAEEFDEYEEFFLFCQHYCVVTAGAYIDNDFLGQANGTSERNGSNEWQWKSVECKELSRRHFGCASMKNQILLTGGMSTRRLNSSILLSTAPQCLVKASLSPPPRMGHTLTAVGGGALLVGGRASPRTPLADCWLWRNGAWKQVHNLPSPRFRHSATAINGGVVIFGGRGGEDCWRMWNEDVGWVTLECDQIPPRWGGAMCPSRGGAIIFGGVSGDAILDDAWYFTVDGLKIRADRIDAPPSIFARLGAKAACMENQLFLVGGVSPLHTCPITVLDLHTGQLSQIQTLSMHIGHEVACIRGMVVVVGGGGVCFSFGAYIDREYHIISRPTPQPLHLHVALEREPESEPEGLRQANLSVERRATMLHELPTQEEFSAIAASRHPTLFHGVDLGPCLRWTPEEMCSRVGPRKVIAHTSEDPRMSFHDKNFSYKTLLFEEVVRRAFHDSKTLVYLRSLSTESRAQPAMLSSDFPELADDFQLPPCFSTCISPVFSSPLRISSAGIGLWLHYDVMANLLCQIQGTKRILLYRPEEVGNLDFPPGASSSRISDPFAKPAKGAMEVLMRAGDVLYIPPLWLHAALPITPCIAVNVFWRDLAPEVYATGRDAYGNRDCRVYEDGRAAVAKILHAAKALPPSQRRFYLSRLGNELLT